MSIVLSSTETLNYTVSYTPWSTFYHCLESLKILPNLTHISLFCFHRPGRRASKLISLITSSFTGNYIRLWIKFLPDIELQSTPLFDGRAVLYPTDQALRDYLSWRQADTHINCQYNTCYWALVNSGKTPVEAQQTLKVRSCMNFLLLFILLLCNFMCTDYFCSFVFPAGHSNWLQNWALVHHIWH
jgi:hypothetical protein